MFPSVRTNISETTCPLFLLRYLWPWLGPRLQRCDTLCTSGFLYDAICAHDSHEQAMQKRLVLKMTHQGTAVYTQTDWPLVAPYLGRSLTSTMALLVQCSGLTWLTASQPAFKSTLYRLVLSRIILCHRLQSEPISDATIVNYTGCGKKSSPLMVFANFSAVVPEFKVKFGTLV